MIVASFLVCAPALGQTVLLDRGAAPRQVHTHSPARGSRHPWSIEWRYEERSSPGVAVPLDAVVLGPRVRASLVTEVTRAGSSRFELHTTVLDVVGVDPAWGSQGLWLAEAQALVGATVHTQHERSGAQASPPVIALPAGATPTALDPIRPALEQPVLVWPDVAVGEGARWEVSPIPGASPGGTVTVLLGAVGDHAVTAEVTTQWGASPGARWSAWDVLPPCRATLVSYRLVESAELVQPLDGLIPSGTERGERTLTLDVLSGLGRLRQTRRLVVERTRAAGGD